MTFHCAECDHEYTSQAAANVCARADKAAHDNYRDGIIGDDV